MSDAHGEQKGATNKDAQRPYQFSEIRYIEGTASIIVPRHSSENRDYIPIGYFEKDEQVVIPDSAFAVYDAEVWLFGVLTSKMHNIWVRAVGGRLKRTTAILQPYVTILSHFPRFQQNRKRS